MDHAFAIAALWLGLAVVSCVIAHYLKISVALVEICIGAAAAALYAAIFHTQFPGQDAEWLKMLASLGAVLLTFLAGAELEPAVLKSKIKEVSLVGIVGFLAPFAGCAAASLWLLHWDLRAALLAGVALSTTSVAVVYAVMLESGLNRTDYGKGVLGACFVNDIGTVLALGIIFSPFTYKSAVFIGVAAVSIALLPRLTAFITNNYAFRTAAIRAKWLTFVLCGLGALAIWAGSEAVLPAYIAGMILAANMGEDAQFLRRLRTLTLGLLTPFYFIRAGSIVSLSAIVAAPLVFTALLAGKIVSKLTGLFPAISVFRNRRRERWYYTLMMSTGLTFGTISSLFGLTHGIITRDQYSFLVAAVIGSAVVPTLIANAFFFPRHLLEAAPVPHEELPETGSA